MARAKRKTVKRKLVHGKYWDKKTSKIKEALGYWQYVPLGGSGFVKDRFIPVRKIGV